PPGCPPSKRNHLSVTGSEQIRDTDPRCEVALSAEHQLRADPQTKHRPAATCTNAPACISARSRGVFKPLTFPLPTSLSRLYAHLRASVWRHRGSQRLGRGRTGQNAPLLLRPGLHATGETPDQRGESPTCCRSRARGRV